MSDTSCPHSPNVNARSDVPYVCMDVHGGVSVPMLVGFRVMHWHDDLQFVHVLAGSVEVKTLGGSVHAMAGEVVFINTGVAHMVVADDACRYCSHLFPVELVRFERATGAASAFHGRDWRGITYDEFEAAVGNYIRDYNENRIKKSLGWMSPNEYRRSLGFCRLACTEKRPQPHYSMTLRLI